MNNINLTVELCTEDRARLDKIIDLLGQHVPHTVSTPSAVDDELREKLEKVVASAAQTVVGPAETPRDATEAPTATDAPAEAEAPATEAPVAQEAVKVTLGDIQGKVIALVQAGKKAEVRAICTAYAPQVTQIPEEKFGEVMAKLAALEG